MVNFWERADVTSGSLVDSNGRDRGRLAGGADVAADRIILGASRLAARVRRGVRIASGKRRVFLKFFRDLPDSSGF